ncbi:hypothetical protein HBH56_204180 [Parastagonospora nodorum]|uniref:Uncharacterized protein n=1 Tax=Phaeosphaeria nodorum (strain SN15 / ATCC MYA-4574 / FGSC 10173) TaxID=321614 RepID=A0A7U2FAX4_PHANO|nr:hypothetical protein HBH56_204180 [Parastagonospora nodorum]QRD01693.1 hypothetical protein JI435_417140 [Parastagonospora nodorum SN15]KAH3923937.1 hypothetical protein HBH54_203060 [Parastagonospora nodorum]KAH3941484.1 hypothetical protein HBH53_201260 [Parastagonospora nodorum]KAH3959543.1 hypothetical protein HBH51_199280 [Parastagonospora nodorum]
MQSPGTGGRSQKSGVVARSRGGDGGRRGWAVSLGWGTWEAVRRRWDGSKDLIAYAMGEWRALEQQLAGYRLQSQCRGIE